MEAAAIAPAEAQSLPLTQRGASLVSIWHSAVKHNVGHKNLWVPAGRTVGIPAGNVTCRSRSPVSHSSLQVQVNVFDLLLLSWKYFASMFPENINHYF